jgi:hypothetical protein
MTQKCPQCTATTKAGDRCKRATCKYAPFCDAHKAYRVGPSEIPNAGRGAFAVRDLKKGDTIGSYIVATVRQTLDEFMAEHPSGRATHTAKVGNHYYTALEAGPRTNQVGMLNTAGRGGRNNARLLASGRVVASRGVKKDDELLLAYGSSYRI